MEALFHRKVESAGKIVAVASSTGGPNALAVILSALPADLPAAVVIAQHIPHRMIAKLATWLDQQAPIRVRTPEAGAIILPGTAYLSPAKQHMEIGIGKRIRFKDRIPGEIYHPSCDLLLCSAADVYAENSMGVILTGMGDDGVQGIHKIREANGYTVAQDEKTCAVFGMPKKAIQKGFINRVLPLGKIGIEIIHWAMSGHISSFHYRI